MLTPEERQEIINEIVETLSKRFADILPLWKEEVYLGLPDLIGTQMAHHSALFEINKKFYGDHPEFRAHKPIVQSVVAQLESKNPLKDYKEHLVEAVPLILERMKLEGKLNMETVKRTERRIPELLDVNNPNGAL